MVLVHSRSKRKSTGGRYKVAPPKRAHRKGHQPTLTHLAARRVKTDEMIGGKEKVKLLATNVVNLYDPKTKKHANVKILAILENPANRNYVRRSIMTRGTVVETEKGKARITSRPGQEGTVNAILI